MLSSNERRGNDFSTPLAGLESRRYVTGPTSTGTVLIPSYTWTKRKKKNTVRYGKSIL